MGTMTLGQAADIVRDKSVGCKDVGVRLDTCEYMFSKNEDGTFTPKLATPVGGFSMESPHATSQLLTKLGIPSTVYGYLLAAGEFSTICRLVQTKLASDHKPKLLRLRNNSVRAVLSDRYSVLNNMDVVNHLLNKLGPDKEVMRCTVRNDVLNLNLRVNDKQTKLPDGTVAFPTVLVQNGETGTHQMKCMEGTFRLICTNGLIIGDITAKYHARHIGRNNGKFWTALEGGLREGYNGSADFMAYAFDKRMSDSDSMRGTLVSIAAEYDIGAEDTSNIFQTWRNYSQERNLFGVVDAVTRYAQRTADPEALDMTAGSIIRMGIVPWEAHNLRGRNLPADIAKKYAVAL